MMLLRLKLSMLVLLIVAACTPIPPKLPTINSPAVAAIAPADLATLHDRLVADATDAIAKAQVVADGDNPTQALYANARIGCYQTILAIAPNIDISAPTHAAVLGPIGAFEVAAEGTERLVSIADVMLSPNDSARFQTTCGWIGNRGVDILNKLNLKVGRGVAGAAFLLPK